MRLFFASPALLLIAAAALAGVAAVFAFSRPAYRPQAPHHPVTTTVAELR